MRVLLIALVILFIALPIDAQLAIVGAARALWLTPVGRSFAGGLLGMLVGGLLVYRWVWNALAYRLYLDDVSKAEDTYRRRRK